MNLKSTSVARARRRPDRRGRRALRTVLSAVIAVAAVAVLGASASADVAVPGPLASTLASTLPIATVAKGTAFDVTKCAWTFEADGHKTGLGFIDSNAGYRDTPMFTNLPGGHWQFRGQYPNARWISFEAYDRMLASEYSISGTSIDPDNSALRNPYRPGGTAKPGDWYTVNMYDRPPSQRVPGIHNVLYGGYRMDPQYGGLMHEESQSVIYRVYDAAKGLDVWGGVPNPRMYWVVDNPTTNLFPNAAAACASLTLADKEYQPWPTTMNVLNAIDDPLLKPFVLPAGQLVQAGLPATNGEPQYAAFRPSSNGYQELGINSKSSYFGINTNRLDGPLLVVHFKAPTYWHEDGQAINGNEQVAYWSWCSVQFLTPLNYTVGCLRDNQFRPDANGYVTLVISNPQDRPVVDGRPYPNWLIMAGDAGLTVMRYMEANPRTFPQSPYYLPQIKMGVDMPADLLTSPAYGRQIKAHMGAYFPQMRYCTTAQFQQNHCGFA